MVRTAWWCALAVLAPAVAASGSDVWDESIQGDLSNDRFNPNFFTLAPGSNELRGTSGDADREFVTMTIPAGGSLTAIILRAYSTPDDVMFIGMVAGPIMTEDPDSPDPGGLLGWTYFGEPSVPVGEDALLPMSFGGQGFTPPLGAGQYAFWIQQLNGPSNYTLDFVVVPGAGSAMVALIGAPVVMRRRRL